MEAFLTPSNIMFTLGLIGILFSVFSYFKNPQIDQDKRDALLAQQVNWQNESVEKRFKDMQEGFNGLLLQSNNHIHTLDVKTDKLSEQVQQVSIQMAKLGIIIEERFPKQKL